MNLVRDHSNLSLLNARNACKIAEAEYIKNPRDADNLTRWGGALIKIYEKQDQDSINDAISKLQEALSLDPCHHEALWCLGEALDTLAPDIINNDKAIMDCIEEAVVCYQRASDLDPSNEIYRKSLEWAIEGLKEMYASDQESTGTTKSSPSPGTKSLTSDNEQNPRNTSIPYGDDADTTNFVRDYYNLSLLNTRNACKIAEAEYIKNDPRDADNLTRWGRALLKMHEYHDIDPTIDGAYSLFLLRVSRKCMIEPSPSSFTKIEEVVDFGVLDTFNGMGL